MSVGRRRIAEVYRVVSDAVIAGAYSGGLAPEELIAWSMELGGEQHVTRDEVIEVLGLTGWAVNEISRGVNDEQVTG